MVLLALLLVNTVTYDIVLLVVGGLLTKVYQTYCVFSLLATVLQYCVVILQVVFTVTYDIILLAVIVYCMWLWLWLFLIFIIFIIIFYSRLFTVVFHWRIAL